MNVDRPVLTRVKCSLFLSLGKRAKYFCLVFILLGSVATNAVYAQQTVTGGKETARSPQRTVYKGIVIDEDDLPLAGVNVTLKGDKSIGVTTNENGHFQIALPEGKNVLVFSYIGMASQEVRVHEGKSVTVRMLPDAQQLGETVVTGIYTRKMDSFTGAASTYKAEELKAIGNQNILQSLSALDPSFVIAENNLAGADPNSMLDISINGKTSINGLSDTYGTDPDRPLFILDGFETTLERISDLSMDRVESITILKDAASAAIYGSKAANGVVVVETKKPEAGRLRFTYNGNYQVSWADLSDYNLMNAAEKLEFEKLSGRYGALDENGEILMDANRALYYSRYRNVVGGLDSYWLSEPLRTAFVHDHSLNAEGGDAAFRYGLTLRYKNAEGVMKNSGRQNIDGTVNLGYRIDRFNFSNQTNIYYTKTDNNVVSFSEFSSANPYYAKYDENGEVYKVLESYQVLGGTEYAYNPLWDFQQKSFNRGDQLTLNNNFNVEFRPFDKMRIVGKFGFTTTRGKTEVFKSPFDSSFTSVEELKRGTFSRSDNNSTSYDGSLLASYGDAIGVHTYNFVGGAQLSENNTTMGAYLTQGYISDNFYNPNFSNSYPDGGKPSSSVAKARSASFYLNGNYAYDMRYLFDFNVRSDGASVFGVNNPFSTTYSLGVAWNIHNEKFFRQSKLVNTLRLRYTFGNPGNQNVDAKLANNVYTYYTKYPNPFGLAAIASKWGNKNLKWKRTQTHNIGLNATLFDRRLAVALDYTLRKSDPELINVEQPTSTGTSFIPMNIGATKNNNVSMTLGYDIIRRRELLWKVTANLLHTTTTYYNIGDLLEKLNQEGRAGQTLIRYYDGASATALWAIRSMGIDPMNGNEVFQKKDGTYTYKWDSAEEVECGDSTPKIQGNLGTTVRYKGFSLGVNFAYRLGGQTVLQTLLNKVENINNVAVRYNQDKRALHDRWQKPGDVAQFKRIDDTSETKISSRFIADENTIQCTSISLGYEDTTSDWIKKAGLSSMTFRIYTNNIFRLSTVKEERGLDYPFSRSVSASLGLRF